MILRFTGLASASLMALAMLPSLAKASEAELFCELASTQAEAEAKVMDTPYAFLNAGNPSISNKVVSAGVAMSLAQARRASLLRERAVAECEAYRSSTAIKHSVEGIPAQIELSALVARRLRLEKVLAIAERNVEIEQNLLAQSDATLADFTTSLRLRDGVAMDLATLMRREAELASAATEATQQPLAELVNDSAAAQARAARIASRVNAAQGWDVTLLAGMRHDFTTMSQSPFVGLTASRSFGYDGAARAADRVGELTAKLMTEQRDGSYQQARRLRQSMEGTLNAETTRQRSLQQRDTAIRMMIERAQSVGTPAARRLLRNMTVEHLTTSAELAASDTRIRALVAWLNANPKLN